MNFLRNMSLLGLVFAQLGAVEFLFEETHQVTITQCKGSYKEPHLLNELWQEERYIDFDNGLGGYTTSSWDTKEKAKDISEDSYSGPVNMIHGWSGFYLIFPDTHYALLLSRIWLDSSFKFKDSKTVVSITENVEKNHWFSSELFYRYVIELNDGTQWTTGRHAWPWRNIWKTGSHILRIGNSQRITFINIDDVRKKGAPVITSDNVQDVQAL